MIRGGADCRGSLRAGESAAQLNSMLCTTDYVPDQYAATGGCRRIPKACGRKGEEVKSVGFVGFSRRAAYLVLCVLLLCAMGAWAAGAKESQATSTDYQERPTLQTSLFQSDKGLMDDQSIQKVLASKFELPARIKIALYRMPESQQQAIRYYGYGYWRSETYLKIQQGFIDSMVMGISKSARVLEVAPLPSMLTPKDPTIPAIRETAVRLQADMLMVFRLTSDVYEKYRLFQSNQAKAYCTCEGVLLDIRTGLIPFSRTITKEYLATKEPADANFNETMARAEKEAAMLALEGLSESTVEFIDAVAAAGAGGSGE